MEKALSEITRSEWIKYKWIDVTQMGDAERIMVQGLLRTPDEALEAMEAWDVTAEERGVEPKEEKGAFNA